MSFSSSSRGTCRQISLDAIKVATDNFAERNVLGKGGEGKVYLANIKLSWTLTQVAVKHLLPNSTEFGKEVQTMSNIQHKNVVSLLGYCDDSGQKILIYEYMEKGSLSSYVRKTRSAILPWVQRLRICLDAARGIQHLHVPTKQYPKGIIHRDIKPDNILLGKDWVAKISDFGIFKVSGEGQEESVMKTNLKGTSGYFAAEYNKFLQVTRKIDVYAFGVVLFQVLCLKMPWDRGNESYTMSENEDLGLWAEQNIDPEIEADICDDSLKAYAEIIGKSLKQDPTKRPTMDDVVRQLEKAIKYQKIQEERAKNDRAAKESDEHTTAGYRRWPSSVVTETITEEYYNSTFVFDTEGGITKAQVITVVLKVHMHCEACAQEIRKRVLRMKGVESAEPELKSSQVTVKGTFGAANLAKYVYKRTGKHAVIVKQDPPPPEEKKEEEDKGKDGKDEKKAEEGGGDKKEDKKEEGGDEKKEGGGGGGDGAAKPAADQEDGKVVELRKNEFYYYHPQNYQVYPARFAAESSYAYPSAPQMFSDENPNACSVM